MNAAKKKADAAIGRGAAQTTDHFCYICGCRHAADGELCPACAKIISARLRLLGAAS